ncbi:MAG: DUF2141 domain-containing protein [Bacteroidales bacterium]|nr:DUF2141 domain-containing protein [Bacteroidales bacterium]
MKLISSLLFVLTILLSSATEAQEVEVTITGLRSTDGQVVFGIFKDDETFQKEEAFLSISFKKKEISEGSMKVSFSLDPGIWGITLLDDENMNSKMEYNFLGIPREGFGFSDYYTTGLTRPKFDNFRFLLEKGRKKKITIRVRYI